MGHPTTITNTPAHQTKQYKFFWRKTSNQTNDDALILYLIKAKQVVRYLAKKKRLKENWVYVAIPSPTCK